jgi:hypothetical protein
MASLGMSSWLQAFFFGDLLITSLSLVGVMIGKEKGEIKEMGLTELMLVLMRMSEVPLNRR